MTQRVRTQRPGLAQTLERAAREGSTRLDLSGRMLTVLPPELWRLTALQRLDLTRNQLTALPPELGQLANLQELYLWDNRLTALRPELGQLANLQRLDLGNNQLTALPPELGQLANLQRLSLGGNRLTALPPELGQLTNLQELFLSNNPLTALPPELGQLTNLQELFLSNNGLTNLPPELGQLTNLQGLDLSHNQLTALPPELGQLTNLQTLLLGDNQLTALPPELGRLTNLQQLHLWANLLRALPPELAQFTNLQKLDLQVNQLTALPPELGQLTKLQWLDLGGNRLTALPPELGQLTNLQKLDLSNNPLTAPPPAVVEQGTEAVLAFLRERLRAGRRQWVSKLLLVGEGGVGKTQLLRRLRGEVFIENAPATHGIEVKSLELKHPSEPGVAMALNAWDFGGQEIYHATHQFFLSGQSLFLVVWNARYGFEQGKLYYWLDTVQARAPDSPVIIVATHVDERDADLPLSDLRRKYPQVLGHYTVSNKTGAGMPELREILREAAAGLPLMGQEWPAAWLDAAEAVRTRDEKYITPDRLKQLMVQHNVLLEDVPVLGQWLHNLGDLLWFQDDEELIDIVFQDPQWVTEYVYKVLDSPQVVEGLGIFTRGHMLQVWGELEPGLRDHFLRLMERFDLSYRTLVNPDISIVVERLSMDEPADLGQKWEEIRRRYDVCNEISMRFELNTTIPAGVPTWFIARQHRFTTRTHWRYGALFADSTVRRHMALVRAFPHERALQLTVRGPHPVNFFALLRDGLELTLARFPGIKADRFMPCPGHNGQPCGYQFDYGRLEGAIERGPPVLEIECQDSFQRVSVPEMLFGLHWRGTQRDVIKRIDQLQAAMTEQHTEQRAEVAELRALVQREFTNAFRREQARLESYCPSVFALTPIGASRWRQRVAGQRMAMHLYCEAPGQWHPTVKGGRYEIDEPAQWLVAVAPYVRQLVSVLKYAAPLVAPGLGVQVPDFQEMFKNQLVLMERLVDNLPELEERREYKLLDAVEEGATGEGAVGAALRALRQLLEEKDPHQEWGSLRRVLTPERERHYLWLCDYHAQEYLR